ncbi:MAG TPA: GNAT family N-acetyltransferase [Tepidisphaeraceae bacterium]
MSRATVRLATEQDLRAIDDIYNWYVPRSTCTYQEEIEPFESRVKWFQAHDERLPVTVAEVNGDICGWGSLSLFRERSAYRFTVENSIYVRHDAQQQGIGAALLQDLIARARDAGHHSIMAIIDAEQTGSIALHAKFNFVHCALLKEAGYKFNRWLDVVYMQLML